MRAFFVSETGVAIFEEMIQKQTVALPCICCATFVEEEFELAIKTLVQRNPLFKSCPESTCTHFIKVNKAEPCIIKCACKRTFCFACTKLTIMESTKFYFLIPRNHMAQSVVHYSPCGKQSQ
ncbi:hypothetical protein niasHS_011270 [Heterodera schachtii]|uniref:IBR domain-containing protein n=1 Tax=Heterodera schachtii TaxID=97005 RepID=A0ABD2J458_HETSC